MHIIDSQNQPVYQESDLSQMELELFPHKTSEEFDRELELERFKRETLKHTLHPLELMDALSHDIGYLKEAFEGLQTGVLRPKDQNLTPAQLDKLAQTMSRSSKNKQYEAFIDENGTRFLVESTLGVELNMKDFEEVAERVLRPIVLQVISFRNLNRWESPGT